MTAQRLLREQYDGVVVDAAPRITMPATVGAPSPNPAAPAAKAGRGTTRRSQLLTPASIYFMTVLAAIAFGVNLPTSAYLHRSPVSAMRSASQGAA